MALVSFFLSLVVVATAGSSGDYGFASCALVGSGLSWYWYAVASLGDE